MEQEPENRITFLGQTNYRDHRFVFGIKKKDRRYHTYIIGQTGTGKSTLLENMIRQDVENGEGLAILDPHGDFAERIAKTVPEKRKDEFVFFDVPNTGVALWIGRILIKLFLSNLHLEIDALERVTMVETYLSLLQEKAGFSEGDKKLILAALFRPANTGLLKGDLSSPHWLGLLDTFIGGKS